MDQAIMFRTSGSSPNSPFWIFLANSSAFSC